MAGLACLPVLAAGCLPYPGGPGSDGAYEIPRDPSSLYEPHRDGDTFFNPWYRFEPGLSEALRLALTRNPFDRSGDPALPVLPNDGRDLAGHRERPRLTWVGHATMAIHDGDDVVLTDPNFASRMLVIRRQTPPGIPVEAVPEDAMAVVSHSHNDHLDAGSVEALPASMHWFVPLGLADWFRARGRENVVELDWWESATHGRWTITCLPAQHWSRRIEHGTNETLWCAWMMDSGDTRYFFAGDTGYFHGFLEYGRRFPAIDVAILPIGAYEPRWFMRRHHVNPAEAYRAFEDLGARYMVPVHWGTFDLAFEPIDRPPQELMEEVEGAGGDPARVRVLAVGEGWDLPPRDGDSPPH